MIEMMNGQLMRGQKYQWIWICKVPYLKVIRVQRIRYSVRLGDKVIMNYEL